MGLFGNRDKRTIAQLENYYANRHGNGKAWAMAFLSLLITLSVLSLLFFGGRWIYRTLVDNGTTVSDITESSQVEEAELPGLNNGEVGGEGSEEPVSGPVVTDVAAGTVSDEAASTSVPNTNSSQTAGASTEVVSGDAIPNTGASEVIAIAIPVVGLIFGYIFSLRRQLRKRNI